MNTHHPEGARSIDPLYQRGCKEPGVLQGSDVALEARISPQLKASANHQEVSLKIGGVSEKAPK